MKYADMSRAYVTLNGKNLMRDFGLNLASYDIGAPVPLVKMIDVPGKPGKLDASLALTGKVVYVSRPITATFHVRDNPYDEFHELTEELLRQFNGVESRMKFSTDPNWFYRGRFLMTLKKDDVVNSYVTFTASEAFPYKLEEYDVEAEIVESGAVICVGREYNGVAKIYCSKVMSLTVDGQTYQLKTGNNVIRELHMEDGEKELMFTCTGTGKVHISYERGIQ